MSAYPKSIAHIEKLLAILERELEVFDRGDRPDYEVIRAVISYFEGHYDYYANTDQGEHKRLQALAIHIKAYLPFRRCNLL